MEHLWRSLCHAPSFFKRHKTAAMTLLYLSLNSQQGGLLLKKPHPTTTTTTTAQSSPPANGGEMQQKLPRVFSRGWDTSTPMITALGWPAVLAHYKHGSSLEMDCLERDLWSKLKAIWEGKKTKQKKDVFGPLAA